MRILLSLLTAVVVSSCAVKYYSIRPGYELSDRNSLKRIKMLVYGPAEMDESIRKVFRAVTRDFVGHHNEYIVYPAALDGSKSIQEYCATERVDGLLVGWVSRFRRDGDTLDMAVESALISCTRPGYTWHAFASGNYRTIEPGLSTLTTSYVNRYGESVRFCVNPFYQVLRKVYESLPAPVLTEADIELKIDVDSMD